MKYLLALLMFLPFMANAAPPVTMYLWVDADGLGWVCDTPEGDVSLCHPMVIDLDSLKQCQWLPADQGYLICKD